MNTRFSLLALIAAGMALCACASAPVSRSSTPTPGDDVFSRLHGSEPMQIISAQEMERTGRVSVGGALAQLSPYVTVSH